MAALQAGSSVRHHKPSCRTLCVTARKSKTSKVEENRFLRALQMNIETIDRVRRPGLALGDQRAPPLRGYQRKDTVTCIGLRFVVEIDARVCVQQHAAHQHDHIDMRRRITTRTARLDRIDYEAKLRV